MKLFHCIGSRSTRVLWALEEMGLPYEMESMPFPPRALREGYLDVNPLGTVPCLMDGGVKMTESAGICQYLVERYGPTDLGLSPADADHPLYLNWLHRSDATLTFPLAVVFRYTEAEPEERRLSQAVADYTQFFFSRLRSVEWALEDRDYLCADRFTIADICVGFAIHFAGVLGLRGGFKPRTEAYYDRLCARPAFQRALKL